MSKTIASIIRDTANGGRRCHSSPTGVFVVADVGPRFLWPGNFAISNLPLVAFDSSAIRTLLVKGTDQCNKTKRKRKYQSFSDDPEHIPHSPLACTNAEFTSSPIPARHRIRCQMLLANAPVNKSSHD